MVESVMSANRMFILLAGSSPSIEKDSCLQVQIVEQSNICHHRFGHLSYKGLCTLQSNNMVIGLPKIANTTFICEACMKGKQHRVPIP